MDNFFAATIGFTLGAATGIVGCYVGGRKGGEKTAESTATPTWQSASEKPVPDAYNGTVLVPPHSDNDFVDESTDFPEYERGWK